MTKNPVLELPLGEVLRPEIALVLAQLHGVCTVGGFLRAWRGAKTKQELIKAFDTPAQARHAAAVCATWLGVRSPVVHMVPNNWWATDTSTVANA